jgi:hypoxanthine phosphoribosyltransferase
VTRYANTTQGRDISWRLPPRDNVRDRTVLVVDDILDEGHHARGDPREARRDGREGRVRRGLRRQGPRARETGARRFRRGSRCRTVMVFGFGMDAYGLWRNLPAIYALKNDK